VITLQKFTARKHTDSLSTTRISATWQYYHQSTKYKCIDNRSLPSAFMISSNFSLDVSLYFLFNTRAILNATPVSCQRYYGTSFYVDCLVTGTVCALPVEDTGYDGTRGGQWRGRGGNDVAAGCCGSGGDSVLYTYFSLLSPL
jgi:hypothetical protein